MIALRLLGRPSYRGAEITSARTQTLLALLAAQAPSGVSSSALAEAIWSDERPANPGKALQVLVSRARSQLSPDLIASTPTGYRLDLDTEALDTAAAQALAAESATALRSDSAQRALDLADTGLALWSSAPESANGDGTALAQLRRDLAPTRTDLARTRGIALSRLGQHVLAAAALEQVAEQRPSDEEVLAHLLRSEAAAVGRAAALARFERYRRALRGRLGADPGPALQQVQAELLDDASPVREGVRHEPNALLGRERDIEALGALVRTSRVTSIVGPGGLGKTRLAHVVSRNADERAVHFIELAGVAAPDGVVVEVASVLGAHDARKRPRPGTAPVPGDVHTRILEALGSTPSLLVLDNCEHVIEAAAGLVDTLVARSGSLRVLTTSRTPLAVDAESVYQLPQLDAATSAELFAQRARAARPDVELEPQAVARVCSRLDGLPLAIELAAARARVMSVAEIDRRLGNRFALLRGGSRSAPARHQTLLAVIDWSWNLLSEPERTALQRLAVFPDGFTLSAAEQVIDGESDGGPIDGVTAVESLAVQSLVSVSETSAGVRYRLLETVREFAAQKLAATGDTATTNQRLRGWARDHAIQWAGRLFDADQVEAVRWLREEEGNLEHVMRAATDDGDAETATVVYAALGAFWSIESNHMRALTNIEALDPLLYHYRPPAHLVETYRQALCVMAGNAIIMTKRRAVRSLSRLRQLPPPDLETLPGALSLMLIAIATVPVPEPELLEELSRRPEPRVAALASAFASQYRENAGDLEGGRRHAQRALDLTESASDAWSRSAAHARIAELAMQVEDFETADHHAELALPGLEQISAWPDVVQQRGIRLLAALRRGDIEAAEALLPGTMLEIAHDNTFGVSVVEFTMRAETDLARGRIDEGLALFRRAVAQVHEAMAPLAPAGLAGLEPWTLHTEATCLAAHTRHGRLADVSGLEEELADKLRQVAASDSTFFFDYPVTGSGLFALGLALMSRGEETGDADAIERGQRHVALARAYGYSRTYPTMSLQPAEATARRLGSTAYGKACEEYGGMSPEDLRAEVLVLIPER